MSSLGTVSSTIMMVFMVLDRRTMSVPRGVFFSGALVSPNQRLHAGSIQGGFWAVVLALEALSHSLWNLTATCGDTWCSLALTLCKPVHLAISGRKLLHPHLYLPSPSALEHPVKMWFGEQRVAPHCFQDGSSLPQIFRLFGVGNRSATACRRNVSFPWSVPQSSFQNSDHSSTCSHCIHCPWLVSPTTFTQWSSSATSQTLCTTSCSFQVISILDRPPQWSWCFQYTSASWGFRFLPHLMVLLVSLLFFFQPQTVAVHGLLLPWWLWIPLPTMRLVR